MKYTGAIFIAFSLLPTTAWAADPDSDAVKALTKVIQRGDDIAAAYPVISQQEVASLERLRGCDATNLMKQKPGDYTVVWICKGGALGMEATVDSGKLASVRTFEVARRPDGAQR